MDYKIIISSIAVLLAFVAYIPYISDALKHKTKPHAFTWFAWSVPGFVAFALQVYGGGGAGAWPLFAGSAICFFVFLMSLKLGTTEIKFSDVLFLILSLFALFLWLVAQEPIWSAILITAVEILGFAPTVRKSWSKPHSETLFTYEVLTVRHLLSIFALAQMNLLTTFYPVSLALADVIFIAMLMLRRKHLETGSDTLHPQ